MLVARDPWGGLRDGACVGDQFGNQTDTGPESAKSILRLGKLLGGSVNTCTMPLSPAANG